MNYTDYLEKIKGFSPNTIRIYTKWAKELDKKGLDYKKVLSSLGSYSSSTMRLIISSMISYYKFLKDNRYLELELPKKEIKVQEFVTYDEYREIIASINWKTKKGLLRRIVVRLLFETGIRSSELLKLTKQDIVEILC